MRPPTPHSPGNKASLRHYYINSPENQHSPEKIGPFLGGHVNFHGGKLAHIRLGDYLRSIQGQGATDDTG